jgi:Flp pilus assembly protein TadG
MTARFAVLRGRRGTSRRGQTLVEFAMVLPVLTLMLVGTVDLGRVVLANDTVGAAAREAARYAIVHGSMAADLCPAGPPEPDSYVPPAPTADCAHLAPSKEAIREVARRWAMSAGAPVVVEVCYGDPCSGDTDALNATNKRGTPVTVTVRSTVTMAAGGLIGFSSFGVVSTSTMRVNN